MPEIIEPILEKNDGGGEVEPTIGVTPDYISAWNALGVIVETPFDPDRAKITDRILTRLLGTDVRNYGQYLKEKYPDRADRLIAASDPEVVAHIDAVVAEFNAQREVMALAPDKLEQVKAFWQRADRLIRQPKQSYEAKKE